MSEVKLRVETEGLEQEPKFKDWEIEDAARTIMRAEEIKQDAELMKLVTPKLEKQVKAAVNAAKVLYGGNEDEEGKE